MKSKMMAADIAALLRARNPLIWIVSREEARVEGYVFEAAASAGYGCKTWDTAAGVCEIDGRSTRIGSTDPGDTLAAIKSAADGNGERCVWIMRDLPAWLDGPIGITTLRALRNLARQLPGVARANAQAVVVLSPRAVVPEELAGHATVIEWPLPDREEIAAVLDAAIDSLPDEIRENAATNGSRDRAIDAAVGLTGEEAAACYARSLVQLRRIDPGLVAAEKKRVVARERVLEWFDPLPGGLDAVGGLDLLKAWLKQRALAYSPAARAYGLPAPRGALLVGVPGCLTGDTIINVSRKQRKGGYKGIRLDALFHRFNGQHREGAKLGLYNKDSREWDLNLPTHAHCYLEDRGYIGFNEIEGVIYSGIKEVCRLTTDHGIEIKATPDHEFLTTRGYVRLDALMLGDELLANEGVLQDDRTFGRRVQKPVRQINNVGNHPYARRREKNGLEYTSHPLHRLVLEAHLNGLSLEDFLWALHGDTTELKFLPEDMEVHHKDQDRDNNTLTNLEPMSKENHARFHMNLENANRYRYGPRLQKVARIERVGRLPTYDIQMKTPNHNFVANGLVVHNCGKSLTAKAVATAWGVPLLRVDLGALKSKFVGESEANLRKAFGVIESVGRCIVWLDEIEKALAGATQGAADGGVSADALGTILNWMQERSGEAFVFATSNDVSALPPELLRKGRFDEIWWVDLPNQSERVDIILAALRAHGRDMTAFRNTADLKEFTDACDGFTGAEIAACVPDALFTAFSDEGREINEGDLMTAAMLTVPLSKTAGEKIERLRAWAVGRARPATSVEVVEVIGARGRAIDL